MPQASPMSWIMISTFMVMITKNLMSKNIVTPLPTNKNKNLFKNLAKWTW